MMKYISPRKSTCFFLILLGFFLFAKFILYLLLPSEVETYNQKASTCGIESDLQSQLNTAGENKFILVVIGDGVKDITPSRTRPYSSNYAQGWDLYEGVAYAMTKKIFNDISKYIGVVFVDDGGDIGCAELISQEVIKYPKVIGVIGHATSSTTKVALENYSKANIPVIFPIATNPTLTENCSNCFRLPSNDKIQAKAIANYEINELKGDKIYLIWDESESSKEYSFLLQKEITNLIGNKIKFRQPISFRPINYEHLLKSIPNNKTDVVIFCGFGSMAREFFNGLRFEYIGKECKEGEEVKDCLHKPKVLLSDGNKISDIKDISSYGFETYLSFPSDKLTTEELFKEFKPENPPKERENMQYEESYEIFGYDALTLFSLAFVQAKGKENISRSSIIEALKAKFSNESLCYKYDFENGENLESRYFIYNVSNDSVIKSYDANALSKMFSDTETPPAPELTDKYSKVEFDKEIIFLNKFADKLKSNLTADGWIGISTVNGTNQALEERESKIIDYLVNVCKVEARRIRFYKSASHTQETELWIIPLNAKSQELPKMDALISGEDIYKKLNSSKPVKEKNPK